MRTDDPFVNSSSPSISRGGYFEKEGKGTRGERRGREGRGEKVEELRGASTRSVGVWDCPGPVLHP